MTDDPLGTLVWGAAYVVVSVWFFVRLLLPLYLRWWRKSEPGGRPYLIPAYIVLYSGVFLWWLDGLRALTIL